MESRKDKKVIFIFLSFAILAFLSFSFYRLGKFVTTDEQFWIYERIPAYWDSLLSGKLKKTYINDKPGVSLAIISGAGLALENDPVKNHKISGNKTLDEYKTDYTEKMNIYFRFPLVIANALLSIYIFWIIRKLFQNGWIALWSSSIIILFPILLGISRVVNPDALLWPLAFAAAMSYFALMKYGSRNYLWLTILFAGLALLTKYVSNILFPFFFFASLLNYFINFEKDFKKDPQKTGSYFCGQIKNIVLIFFGSALIFSLLMPAAFGKIKYLYRGTLGSPALKIISVYFISILLLFFLDGKFNKGLLIHKISSFLNKARSLIISALNFLVFGFIVLVLTNWMTGQGIADLTRIPVDARSKEIFTQGTSLFEKIMLEFFPFVFTIPPLILLLFILLIAKNICGKDKPYTLYTTSISVLIIIFFAGAIMSDVLFTPRYDVMLFPFVGLLAGLSLRSFFPEKNWTIEKNILASLLIILSSAATLWMAKPFYYSYASPLLPRNYTTNNTWGFGGYEAAQYLNSLPNAQNIVVWSDYRGTCEFFRGKCIITTRFDREEYPVDYYVLTKRGQSRMNFALINEFEVKKITPEWELLIGQRSENYIKVMKAGR